MYPRFVPTWAVFAVACLPLTVRPDEDKDKGRAKNDPPGVPLQAILKANKTTYPLDLGGKTAEQFRQLLKKAEETGEYPAPPAVDLVLELKNTGDKVLQVWVGGDMTRLMLHLEGPAAVNTELKRLAFTRELRLPRVITLAPGKSHKFEIEKLAYGFRAVSNHSYWLKPGEYTLTARYLTGVSPAPKGADDAGEGFGKVNLTSAPIKLKVEAE